MNKLAKLLELLKTTLEIEQMANKLVTPPEDAPPGSYAAAVYELQRATRDLWYEIGLALVGVFDLPLKYWRFWIRKITDEWTW